MEVTFGYNFVKCPFGKIILRRCPLTWIPYNFKYITVSKLCIYNQKNEIQSVTICDHLIDIYPTSWILSVTL